MDDRDPPSDRPATPHLLERLRAEGVLSREAYERARELVWPGSRLFHWLDRSLLVAGAALLAAGVGYWLVHHWTTLPRLAKFGVAETAMVSMLVAAAVRGYDEPLGSASIAGAVVAVGATLILVGLTYPTGADAWQLFALWAGVTAGFALVARSQLVWLLWIAIVDAAAGLLWLETIPSPSHTSFTLGTSTVGGLTLVAAGVLEVYRNVRRPDWLTPPWSRWILLIGGFGFLSLPVWTYLGTGREPATWIPFGVTVVWVLSLAAAYVYYRRRRFDLVSVTIVALAAVSTPIIRVVTAIVEYGRLDLALLIGGLVVLAGSSTLVWWLSGIEEA